jgi:hypothetical protein
MAETPRMKCAFANEAADFAHASGHHRQAAFISAATKGRTLWRGFSFDAAQTFPSFLRSNGSH